MATTDRRGNTTTTTYDALDRPTTVTDALGQTSQTAYDPLGNIISQTNKRGFTTEHQYDGVNRLLQSTHNLNDTELLYLVRNTYNSGTNRAETVTDARGNSTTYHYDWADNITREDYADGTTAYRHYDNSGWLTKHTDESGFETTYTYNNDGTLASTTNAETETSTYQYDLFSNRIHTIKPKLNIGATHTYDALNRLVQTDKPLEFTATYRYDLNNNLTEQNTPAANDTGTSRVTYTYDNNNRRISHHQHLDGNTLTETYTYLPEDLLATKTDPNGYLFSYSYDALNRQTQQNFDATANADISRIETTYDANNNITQIVERKPQGAEVTALTYDSLDRNTQQTQRGYALNYTYDSVGNRTRVQTTGGSTDYTYDTRNRLSTAATLSGTTTYTYLANNWQDTISHPNGTRTDTDYDNAGRITQRHHTDATDTTLSRYTYAYDPNGNRSQQIEQQNGFVDHQQQTTTYTYDLNDRLTHIDILDADTNTRELTHISYWPSFDRKQHTVTTIDPDSTQTTQQNRLYTYDALYRLHTITDQLTGHTINYTFDDNGNTLNKTDNTQSPVATTDYTYNPRNHLKTVTHNGTSQGDYHYNYAGLRIHHNNSHRGDITYYHDGLATIDEHANGQQYSHYNYGSQQLLSLTTQTDTHYYHLAALGTTANLTDTSGATHASYRSDAFGHITRQQGNSQNRHIYTGHEHDTETGLIYMKARYYDPDTSRFLNQDSYLGTPDEAPSLHRYLYAYSNPNAYVDPDGRSAEFVGPCIASPCTDETLERHQKQIEFRGEFGKEILTRAVDSVKNAAKAIVDPETHQKLMSVAVAHILSNGKSSLNSLAETFTDTKNDINAIPSQLNTADQLYQQGDLAGAAKESVDAASTVVGVGTAVTGVGAGAKQVIKSVTKNQKQPIMTTESQGGANDVPNGVVRSDNYFNETVNHDLSPSLVPPC